MRRNVRQRATACLLALLAQAGFIALFVLDWKPYVKPERDDSPRLTFIQAIGQPQPRHQPPRDNHDNGSATAVIQIADGDPIVTGDRDTALAPPDSISDVPAPAAASGINWYGVMESAAPGIAEEMEERERNGDPLDSRLKAMDIPERPRKAGDEERYPDGTVVTWLGERCYVILDPVGSGPRPKMICKASTLAERRAEAHRKELERALMPEYLRRPLPKPPPANPVR